MIEKEYKIEKYTKEIFEKINTLKERHNSLGEKELLIAYRGESKDYGRTKLVPSLFRDDSIIKKEKYIFELLSDYNLIHYNKRNIDKAIAAQHYLSISRMLDISFNCLIALYFACQNQEEDGFLYVFAFPEHYSPNSDYIENFYNRILDNKNISPYYKNFKVITHSYSNDRVKAQSGGFIFFPGESAKISGAYYEEITIKRKDKQDLLNELKELYHIEEFTIFPEKDKLANFIREEVCKKETNEYEFSIENEVRQGLKRTFYEIEINDKLDDIGKRRILRKAKYDLCTYLEKYLETNSVEKEKLKDVINKYFEYKELLKG